MKSNIIALLSDLGVKDYFVGAMKGSILSINPEAKIIDVTHEVPKHDVQAAAFTLANAAATFPPGSIFVAVVDPGVGTKRKCILLQTKNGLFFIGPDNRLFTIVVNRFGIARAYEVTNRALMRHEISPTFHGRDIMAPVAAHLTLGVKPSEVGPELREIELFELPQPVLTEDELKGQIMNVDDFGNLVTNIDGDMISKFAKLGDALVVRVADNALTIKFSRTFGEVDHGKNLCYIGSSGMVELAKNMGNLAGELKVKIGDKLTIRKVT